jgi:hypothetical protein
MKKTKRPDFLMALLHSRKFWLAIFGIAQSLIFTYVPNFPKEVWQSIDALVIVLIATIAAEDVAAKAGGGSASENDNA